MTDPNRPLSDPEAANQAAPVQQPPDAAEAPPADPSQSTESLPAAADSTENFVAEDPLAAGDVSLVESPSLAENGVPPEVFSQNAEDAFDGSQSPAPIESADDMLGTLDLQPWLSDSTDSETDADPSSFPDDFAASPSDSPPRFTGPLVEKSPGVFVSAQYSMPWSADIAAQPTLVNADLPWLQVTLNASIVAQLADQVLQRTTAMFHREIDQKVDSKINELEFIRAAERRAIYGR